MYTQYTQYAQHNLDEGNLSQSDVKKKKKKKK